MASQSQAAVGKSTLNLLLASAGLIVFAVVEPTGYLIGAIPFSLIGARAARRLLDRTRGPGRLRLGPAPAHLRAHQHPPRRGIDLPGDSARQDLPTACEPGDA